MHLLSACVISGHQAAPEIDSQSKATRPPCYDQILRPQQLREALKYCRNNLEQSLRPLEIRAWFNSM